MTEFSVVWAFDGIRWQIDGDKLVAQPVGPLRSDRLRSYLESMLSWLEASAPSLNLERWFLFASHQHREPWATAPGGIGLVEGTGSSARLTELGELYRDVAQSGPPPPYRPCLPRRGAAPDRPGPWAMRLSQRRALTLPARTLE